VVAKLFTLLALLLAAQVASAQNVAPSWRISVEKRTVRITVSAKPLPTGASVTKAVCTVEFLDSGGSVWESVQIPIPGLPIPAGEERSYARAIPITDPVYIVRGVRMDWAVTQRPGPVVGARPVGGSPPVPTVAPDGSSAPDVEFVAAREPQEIGPSFRCSDEARLMSPTLETLIPTVIEFRNEGTRPRVVYWLDTNGGRRPFGEVAPGEARTFRTYRGHNWVITEKSGECMGIFIARAVPAWTVLRQ
jgi:hypothetical protein